MSTQNSKSKIKSSTDILIIFKNELISFLNDLLVLFPSDEKLIYASVMIRDYPNFAELMGNFISDLFPLKEKVKTRDENYLLSNKPLIYEKIEKFEKGIVADFKHRWRANTISKENKEALWRWGDKFIKIGEAYLKFKELENRQPIKL